MTLCQYCETPTPCRTCESLVSRLKDGEMHIRAFGDGLIRTGDLDPVYYGLAAIPKAALPRFLFAYWTLYEPGSACWLSEQVGSRYWDALQNAALNDPFTHPLGWDRWTRGQPRRHWRGRLAQETVARARERFVHATNVIEHIRGAGPSASKVIERCQELYGFGHWIAFKAADMLEQAYGGIVFSDDDAMYDVPAECARVLDRYRYGSELPNAVQRSVDFCKGLFARHDDPSGRRKVNIQEVETILCKWGATLRGSYKLGKDIVEIDEYLEPWAKVSSTARSMRDAVNRRTQSCL